MIGELAASGTAAAWGGADFCGGKASRRVNPAAVVVVSQLASLPLLAAALLLTADAWPGAVALGWGLIAGLSGGTGLVLLYRGLAAGVMSVVAPITGVTAALIALVVGLVADDPPGAAALVGAGVAVLAIWLVSVAPGGSGARPSAGTVALALAAGAAFGMFYVLLAPVGPDAQLWPLVGVRGGSMLSAFAFLAATAWSVRRPSSSRGPSSSHGPGSAQRPGRLLRLPGGSVPWVLGAGALDIFANAFYLAAVYYGALSVVGPIASLYPAGTVLLAVIVDRERLRPLQSAALGLSVLALLLTHLG